MRYPAALLALCLLVFSGCSDDTEKPEANPASSKTPEAIRPTGCELSAELGGAGRGSLRAEGEFNASQDASQPSLYIFDSGSSRLTVFASDGDFPTSVTYQGKEGRFASQDATGIDVATDGSGGSLDVVLSGNGNELTVTGDVVCGADREGKGDSADKKSDKN